MGEDEEAGTERGEVSLFGIAHCALIDEGLARTGSRYDREHGDGERIDAYCVRSGVDRGAAAVFLHVLAAVAHAHAI